MDQRVQRTLDRELPREALSPEEAEGLAAAEAMIAGVLREVPGGPGLDLAPAVLQRIQASDSVTEQIPARARTTAMRRLLEWFWAPRPLSLQWRPVYALGLALALVLGAFASGLAYRSQDAAPAASRQVLVQFRLDAPNARAVTLAGDFTRWQPAHTLTRSQPGIWTVVVALEPGVHDYAFVVDGERWTPDPMAPAVADGFGGLNSRLAVLSPDLARPL